MKIKTSFVKYNLPALSVLALFCIAGSTHASTSVALDDPALSNNIANFIGFEVKQGVNDIEPTVTAFNQAGTICKAKKSLLGEDYTVLENMALHLGRSGSIDFDTDTQGNCTNISFRAGNITAPVAAQPSVTRDYGLVAPNEVGSTISKPCAARTPLTINASMTGSLTATDCIYDSFYDDTNVFDRLQRYTDRFSFNALSGQKYFINLSGSFDTFVTLKDESGAVLARNNNGGGGTNSRIPATTGTITIPVASGITGKFVVEVTSRLPKATGSYNLTVTKQ